MFVCLDALPVQDDCPSANIFSTTRVLGHQHNGERPVGDFAQTQLYINHVPLTGYQNIKTLHVPLTGYVQQNINTVPFNIVPVQQPVMMPPYIHCPVEVPVPLVSFPQQIPLPQTQIQTPNIEPLSFEETVPRFVPQMFQTQSSLIQVPIRDLMPNTLHVPRSPMPLPRSSSKQKLENVSRVSTIVEPTLPPDYFNDLPDLQNQAMQFSKQHYQNLNKIPQKSRSRQRMASTSFQTSQNVLPVPLAPNPFASLSLDAETTAVPLLPTNTPSASSAVNVLSVHNPPNSRTPKRRKTRFTRKLQSVRSQ